MIDKMVKAAFYGGKNEELLVKKTSFQGMRADRGEWYSNVELGSLPFLRAHKPLLSVKLPNLPADVRAIRAYGDHLLLLNMESGFFGVYHMKDDVITKTGTSIKSFPPNSDGSDYCNRLILVDEKSEAVDNGCSHLKLLIFPNKQLVCLNSAGIPTLYTVLPTTVPAFEHAALLSGRLCGSVGQKIFVSGAGGCFDWTYDASEEERLPEHAWSAGNATDTGDDPKITALVPYKNTVLIFRKNAMQALVGQSNPFAVKELFKVGSPYGGSVKEVDGKIYFITDNGVACYNGSAVRRLPDLPAGTVLNGAAAVLDGKYCFYGQNGLRHYLYSYDEKSDSYAVCKCDKRVRALENCGGKLYALMGDQGQSDALYRVHDDRSSCYMEAEIPLVSEELSAVSVRELRVRVKMTKDSSMRLSLRFHDEKGESFQTLFDVVEASTDGEVTWIKKQRMKRAYGVTLCMEAEGDVILKGAELRCTLCRRAL